MLLSSRQNEVQNSVTQRVAEFCRFSAVAEMSHNLGDLKAFWGNFFANFCKFFYCYVGAMVPL